MKFYKLDGNEINSIDEFIDLYSKDYYLKKPGEKGLIPGLRRSSEFIEERIEGILESGIQDQVDVGRILAWKIGKIKHRVSENENRFAYAKGWENVEHSKTVKLYNDDFQIEDISSFILSLNIPETFNNDNAQELLNQIMDKRFKRLGSVYMITLLYFLSKGEYPIYDRFAMMALTAICSETPPKSGEKVTVDVAYKELPAKESFRFEMIMDEEMAHYIQMLNDIFGVEWKTNRKIDQALWVYGHLFKMN